MDQENPKGSIVKTTGAELAETGGDADHVGIREATEKRLIGFTEGDPTIRLKEKDIVTIQMFMRIANYEERPEEPGELLADMLECYVKRHYPHFELEYEESPKKRKKGVGPLPVESAAAAAASGPSADSKPEDGGEAA